MKASLVKAGLVRRLLTRNGSTNMRRGIGHLGAIGFWLGFLIIAINQLLEVTLVTTQDHVDSVVFTLTNATDSALLPLGCYVAIGVGLRLLGKKCSRYYVPLSHAEARSGS